MRKGRKPSSYWQPTGFHGRRCIEVSLGLPGLQWATCWLRSNGRWSYYLGSYAHEKVTASRFKYLASAKVAAEDDLRSVVTRGLNMLKGAK